MYYFSRTDIEFCSLNYVISYGHVLPRNLLSTGQVFLGLPHNRLTTTTHYADFKKGLGAVTKRYFFITYSILFQRKSKVVVQFATFIPIYFYIFIYCLICMKHWPLGVFEEPPTNQNIYHLRNIYTIKLTAMI